jgi:rod shape-determining protein MreC
LVRLAFYVVLSLLLLVSDMRFHTLEWVRMALTTVTWPLQRVAYLPVEAGGDLSRYFSTLGTLRKENEELRRRQLATAQPVAPPATS